MKKLIIISGPTGSGKTDLAIQIALHFNTEIISADSRQVYKDLEIGTAQPDSSQLSSVKHHLVGFLNVGEDYNAGLFEQDALKILDELFSKKDVVVLCGGTGLYIEALLHGMDELPEVHPSIRSELEKQYQLQGIIFLQQEIKQKDPEFAATADLMNPQRLIRALEVCIASGLPYSSFRTGKKANRNFEYIYYALYPQREILYNQINTRTDKMFAAGLVEEVRKMIPFRTNNALQTVGYKEVFDFFDGILSLEEAKEKVKQHTRNYAKRQLTWFKKRHDIIFIDPINAFGIITGKA